METKAKFSRQSIFSFVLSVILIPLFLMIIGVVNKGRDYFIGENSGIPPRFPWLLDTGIIIAYIVMPIGLVVFAIYSAYHAGLRKERGGWLPFLGLLVPAYFVVGFILLMFAVRLFGSG